jgi:CRISPR-associated protein Csm2
LERKFIEKRDSTGLAEAEAYNFIHPMVKLTRAKAEYAKGRKLVPVSFLSWFNDCVKNINNADEFKAFLLHFEAIVGYCYGAGLKD